MQVQGWIKSTHGRLFLAELLGTFILVFVGNGAVAQAVLSKNSHGNFFTINWGYGIAVMMGAYVSIGISGAHLNPAVTLALAVSKKISWTLVPTYFAAQYLGAFLSGPLTYLVYYDALYKYSGGNLTVGGPTGTAGVWSTYLTDGISLGNGFFDQICGTFILLFCVRAVTDSRNADVPKFLTPFVVGFVVVMIGTSFGYNSGYALNPARDLGPRIFSSFLYGGEVFRANNNWSFVPVVATHIGGVLGSLCYGLLEYASVPIVEEAADKKRELDI